MPKKSSEECSSSEQLSKNGKNWSAGYRKYSRITPEMKNKLIFLIVQSNMSIKQAAQHLNINYSSAKFIFSQYRDKNIRLNHPQKQRNFECVFRKLEEGENDAVVLKFTVGGKYEGQSHKLIHPSDLIKTFE